MPVHVKRALGLLLLVGTVGLTACDSSPTDPPPAQVPAEVEVTPGEVAMTYLGATTALAATVRDEDGAEISDAQVTWSSSDESVAVVNEAGVVEATGNGAATITVQSGEVSAQVGVTVEQQPAAVELSEELVLLDGIGATVELSAAVVDQGGSPIEGEEVTWSSSDEAVAVVDEDGVVEAVDYGSATITAESGELSGSVEVLVQKEPAAVEVSPEEAALSYFGATVELSAVVVDEDGTEVLGVEVTWSSSDEAVATVNEDGVVEAVGNGTATITAEGGDVSGSAAITVEQEAATVEVEPDEVTLDEIGATAELSAAVFDAGGTEIEDAEVTWSSSDEAVATVDEDGVVEAVGEGTATITAESGEASGSAEVTVEVENGG